MCGAPTPLARIRVRRRPLLAAPRCPAPAALAARWGGGLPPPPPCPPWPPRARVRAAAARRSATLRECRPRREPWSVGAAPAACGSGAYPAPAKPAAGVWRGGTWGPVVVNPAAATPTARCQVRRPKPSAQPPLAAAARRFYLGTRSLRSCGRAARALARAGVVVRTRRGRSARVAAAYLLVGTPGPAAVLSLLGREATPHPLVGAPPRRRDSGRRRRRWARWWEAAL